MPADIAVKRPKTGCGFQRLGFAALCALFQWAGFKALVVAKAFTDLARWAGERA